MLAPLGRSGHASERLPAGVQPIAELGEGRPREARAPPPPQARRAGAPPREPRSLVFWILSVLGALLAASATYILVIYPAGSGPGGGKDVELTIERDEPLGSVIDKLDRAGLVGSRARFTIYARLVSLSVAPGPHLLTDDASPQELVHRLERLGAASKAKVTIPEGWNRFDIAKRLQTLHVASQAAFLDATADPSSFASSLSTGTRRRGFSSRRPTIWPRTPILATSSVA